EVVAMLNSYFEEMVDAVFKYGGTLDKYIGDALMAVFGSPAPLAEHPWCAMQAAIDMRARLIEFNNQRIAADKMPISIGMGIHSDQVVSGNIGSSKRMELTSIGDGVNLASRLEGTSKQYGTDIIISNNTYHPYKEKLWVRELDLITVKGKTEPVRIYELVGIKEGPLSQPLTQKQQDIIGHYSQGRKYYLSPVTEENLSEATVQDIFKKAEAEFQTVLQIDPNNKAAKLHVGRCQLFQHSPPPADWDGVWKLTEK
ncbi:MAG: adenylate/guanylate cyclase domain-containing protein, partial [Microcoleaceae cyanobacterium]